jgi:hypothetical protein
VQGSLFEILLFHHRLRDAPSFPDIAQATCF